MPKASRDNLVKGFVKRNPPRSKPFNPSRIQEDDPLNRWNPGLQGNRRWGKKYRGVANYSKGPGRPD